MLMFFDAAALVFISTQMYNQEDEIEVHTREWKGGTSLFRDVPLPLESVFLGRSSVLNGVYDFISAYPKPVFIFSRNTKHIYCAFSYIKDKADLHQMYQIHEHEFVCLHLKSCWQEEHETESNSEQAFSIIVNDFLLY